MRDYELTVIYRPDEENFKAGKELVAEHFKKFEAQILKEEDQRVRELAYPIKKTQQGHYVYYEVKVAPNNVIDLDHAFKLDDQILKYLFVKKEDK